VACTADELYAMTHLNLDSKTLIHNWVEEVRSQFTVTLLKSYTLHTYTETVPGI